ncbi:MAG: DUF4911 domain-containing protein [Deltaproteobacteria bacterium]|nr:DUF4911 domain-containing protein [Deltaproteobacteria bacterium]
MPVIYIKLKNPSKTVYFQSIIGTYTHIAWTRTENAEEGIIKVSSTDDTISQARRILQKLKSEIDFEEIK